MINRATAITELVAGLTMNAAALGIKRIKSNPASPVDPYKLVGVHFHTGDDKIIKAARRDGTGYPKMREASVIVEIWLSKSDNADLICDQIRGVLFDTSLSNGSYVVEQGVFGPINGGIPETQTIQLFMGLVYVDNGP